jgi:hypothetical protein
MVLSLVELLMFPMWLLRKVASTILDIEHPSLKDWVQLTPYGVKITAILFSLNIVGILSLLAILFR